MSECKKCDLSFVCSKKWDDLASTESSTVRFCDACSKGVFAVQTRAELSVAFAVGRCISIARDNEILGWIGEAEGEWDWMEEQTDSVFIRANILVAADVLKRIQLAFPAVFCAGLEWRQEDWLVLGTFSPYVAKNLVDELIVHFPEVEVRRTSG